MHASAGTAVYLEHAWKHTHNIHNLQPSPTITTQSTLTPYIITAWERQEGMIDAAEQEIHDCRQKIEDIQHALDNPADNNNNNTTYERKQKYLRHMQSHVWNKIRHLNFEISHL